MATWNSLKRHQLSAEYKDITGPAWFGFCLKFKRIGFLAAYPIILDNGMVLDGWQRLRACIETGIEPVFGTIPNGISPEDYVQSVNDERRHETSKERQERIDRVAERRKAGERLRTIAENEGVSEATVRNDLAESGAQVGCAPEPPDGKVTGKDGKKQPARKPKPPGAAKSLPKKLTRQLLNRKKTGQIQPSKKSWPKKQRIGIVLPRANEVGRRKHARE